VGPGDLQPGGDAAVGPVLRDQPVEQHGQRRGVLAQRGDRAAGLGQPAHGQSAAGPGDVGSHQRGVGAVSDQRLCDVELHGERAEGVREHVVDFPGVRSSRAAAFRALRSRPGTTCWTSNMLALMHAYGSIDFTRRFGAEVADAARESFAEAFVEAPESEHLGSCAA